MDLQSFGSMGDGRTGRVGGAHARAFYKIAEIGIDRQGRRIQ